MNDGIEANGDNKVSDDLNWAAVRWIEVLAASP